MEASRESASMVVPISRTASIASSLRWQILHSQRCYNTTVDALRKLNNLKGNKLAVGKRLRVPGSNIRG